MALISDKDKNNCSILLDFIKMGIFINKFLHNLVPFDHPGQKENLTIFILRRTVGWTFEMCEIENGKNILIDLPGKLQ